MSQSFGASLREARERKGVSLRQIATATKISVAALESLERNDFSRLPGGLFSRAFVRSYALEVGLDPDETVRRFLLHATGEPHDPSSAEEITETDRHVEQPVRGKQAGRDFTPEFEFQSQQRIASIVLKLVAISIPVAAAILYAGSRSWVPAPQHDAQARADRPRPVAEEPAGTDVPRPAVPRPAPDARLASLAPAATPAAPTPAADAAMVIELAPTGDCWAKLSVDGTVVVSRVMKAGEREARSFTEFAVLQVGDAAACAIAIDGRPARPLGPPQKVREVRITRDNYPTYLP
jgi:cytoskeleton protein RodZ